MATAISFCFFLVLMMAVGFLSSLRKDHSAEDYLTAGRSHGKFAIALSGAASATSGFIMIGAVGAGYALGFLAVLMPLSWFFGDLLFWTLFPSRINRLGRESNCSTVPELISHTATGKRTSGLRKFLAAATILFVGLYAIGQFLAAGKAVNGVFEIPISWAIVLSAFVIVVYSAKGGLKSSIPTQFLQAIIMLFTTVGMFLLALFIGGGPAEILADLRSVNSPLLSLDGGRGILLLFVFILGFATAAFSFDIGQPHLLVRILATKSPQEAYRARWIYIAFMQATWVSMSLFGLIMAVLLPDIADPEQALPMFASGHLHPILVGAVLAGIFAAIASTLDGLILVLSSSFGVDLVPEFYERMSRRFGSRYQAMVTLAVTVVTMIAATAVVESTTVFAIIVFSASGLGVSIGCAMLISILRWRTSTAALVVSIVCAVLVTAIWRYAGLSDTLLEAFPGFLTGLAVHQAYSSLFLRSDVTG